MDLGTVDYFGVTRQYNHPLFTFYQIRGLPGWPKNLLTGLETAAQLAKNWMCSIVRNSDKKVLFTFFFDNEASAIAQIKLQLATLGLVPQSAINRIQNSLTNACAQVTNKDLQSILVAYTRMDLA